MMTHPALHEPPGVIHDGGYGGRHFVPEGWEDTDRGICPCGEAVRWDPATETWVVDRSLVVLVLTREEVTILRNDALYIETLEPVLDLQMALNETIDDTDADDFDRATALARLATLEREFDAAGGRGPDLADEIDALRITLGIEPKEADE